MSNPKPPELTPEEREAAKERLENVLFEAAGLMERLGWEKSDQLNKMKGTFVLQKKAPKEEK